MTTNILNLPQLSGSMTVATNADWRDTIQFQWPTGSTNAGQPLDITGIAFQAQLRPTIADARVLLDMSTTNGLLVVDAQLGQLSFAVPRDLPTSSAAPQDHMLNLPSGTTCFLDILAIADGVVLNLCQVSGSIAVTVNQGVTRE